MQQEITDRNAEADTLRANRLDHARYEAELSLSRIITEDPGYRLVANTLEADWNEQLHQLDALQQEQDQQRDAYQRLLSEEARISVL